MMRAFLVFFVLMAMVSAGVYADATTAYVGNSATNLIYQINLTNGNISQITPSAITGAGISSVAVLNSMTAYAAGVTSNGIYRVDLTNGNSTQLTSFPGAGIAELSLASPTQGYAVGSINNAIYRVNLINGNATQISSTFRPGTSLRSIAFEMTIADSPTVAYVSDAGNNLIYRVDLINGTVTQVTPSAITGASLRQIALVNNNTAYVAGLSGFVYKVDLTNGNVTQTSSFGGNSASGLALATNTIAYASVATTNLYYIDLISGTNFSVASSANVNRFSLLLQIGTSRLSGNNLRFANYLNANAPQTTLPLFALQSNISSALEAASPTRNAIFTFASQTTQLSFGQQVYNHLTGKRWRKAWQSSPMLASQSQTKTAQAPLNQNRFFSDASDATLPSSESSSESDSLANVPAMILCRKKVAQANVPAVLCKKEAHYSPWLGILGEYTHERSQHQTPSFNTGTGGFVLATDYYRGIHPAPLLGGGMAYAYTHVHEADDAGYANINQGALVLYGAWMEPKWYINWALWGGYYHAHNVREINLPGVIGGSATSNTHGWQLTPHLEVGYTYEDNLFGIEPFEMIDWVACWEEGFQEHGAGKLNMGQKDRFCSLLRNELGIRFNETLLYDWGTVTFREKGSYVYQKAFHTGVIRAFLVGSAGSFVVSTLTGAQNLGVVEFESLFVPTNKKYPYATISSQAELGLSYQSYQGMVSIGKDF